jgi:hypothetical protein
MTQTPDVSNPSVTPAEAPPVPAQSATTQPGTADWESPFSPPAQMPPIPAQFTPPEPRQPLPGGSDGSAPPQTAGTGMDGSWPSGFWAPVSPASFSAPSGFVTAAPPSPLRRWRWLLVGGGVGLALLLLAAVVVLAGADEPAGGPVVSHRAEAGEPLLIDVPGYTYADVSARENREAREGMEMVNRMLPDFYVGVAAHNIQKPGAGDMQILQMQLSAEAVWTVGDNNNGLLGSLVAQGATDAALKTIADREVAYGTVEDGTTNYAWFDDGVLVVVTGEDRSDTTHFVEAYLAEVRE